MGFVDTVRALLPGKTATPPVPDAPALSEKAEFGAPAEKRAAGDFTSSLRKDPAWVDTTARLAVPAPDKNAPTDKRIGGPGTTIRFGRIQREEFNLDLENEKGVGDGFGIQGVFDKMRRTDPEIRQTLSLLSFPLLCATPKMEPGDETALAAEIAEFVSYNLFELNPWQPQIRHALTMLPFGFAVSETLWGNAEVPRSRFPNLPQAGDHPKGLGDAPGPGRPALDDTVTAFCLTACDGRAAKTIFQWAADPERPERLRFLVQRLPVGDTEQFTYRAIPADRLLRWTHEQEGGNFAGTSAIRAAFKPWKIKEALETTDAIRHDRQNVGIAVLELPQEVNVDELAKLETILSRIGSFQGSWMSLPCGYKFRFETSGQGEGTKVELAIDRCTREILDATCAGFMALGNGDVGSYAMADVQKDAGFENAIEAKARLIEHGYNHGYDGWSPIKRLVDLNYGPQVRYPRFRLTNLRNGMLNLLAKLLTAGGVASDKKLRDYIRANLNLPAEGEVDVRVEDDPRDTKKQIQEEQAPGGEETVPGKSPQQAVPGDGGPRTKPAAPGAPAPTPSQVLQPAKPASPPPPKGPAR